MTPDTAVGSWTIRSTEHRKHGNNSEPGIVLQRGVDTVIFTHIYGAKQVAVQYSFHNGVGTDAVAEKFLAELGVTGTPERSNEWTPVPDSKFQSMIPGNSHWAFFRIKEMDFNKAFAPQRKAFEQKKLFEDALTHCENLSLEMLDEVLALRIAA